MGYYYQTNNGVEDYYVNLKTGEIKTQLSKNDIEVEGFITDLEEDNKSYSLNIPATTLR